MPTKTINTVIQAYPYIVIRIAPAVYQPVLCPEKKTRKQLIRFARHKAKENEQRLCLVFGKKDCIYFEADGTSTWRRQPPRGGTSLEEIELRLHEAEKKRQRIGRTAIRKASHTGVTCTMYTVVIVLKSLKQKHPDTLKDLMARFGRMENDGKLASMVFMDGDEMNTLIEDLKKNGLQCDTAPVDFYVIDAGIMPKSWRLFSKDDGRLELSWDAQAKKVVAKLKEGTEEKSI